MSTFTVQKIPDSSPQKREAFQVYLTAAALLGLKMKSGDLCALSLLGDEKQAPLKLAIVAGVSSNMKESTMRCSHILQMLYSFKLNDKVKVIKFDGELQDARGIVLKPCVRMAEAEQNKWSLFASVVVPNLYNVVAPGQTITYSVGDEKRDFNVEAIEGVAQLARVTKDTVFNFTTDEPPVQPKIKFEAVGGLRTQTEQIQQFFRSFLDTRRQKAWARYPREQGLLLYGAKGTGKSMLLGQLASTSWAQVIEWSPGLRVTRASGLQLVTIEFDRFVDKEAIANHVEILFKSIKGTPTIVVGAVRHPNKISERLRKKDAFAVEIEIPIPTADQRLEILRALRGEAHQPSSKSLGELSYRTHGFVGADLERLLVSIWDTAFMRHDRDHGLETSNEEGSPLIIDADIEGAFASIRPSALEEIFLEKPNVRWTDIGGQHEIKKQLQNAVERPLKYPNEMKALGIKPTKGVLLYGPPGCSKTLMVKALATEADLNFLAVKGAELISMYVGESERALREIFRKARQASPCIVFFDEIDAIATRGRTGGDLNVLTTLLIEMDGFEELNNVLVVAATNKPESIDPALMRPGRFDRVVYVGPPDLEAREEIIEKCLTNVSVDAEVREKKTELAQKTDGSSGAEIVEIFRRAGENAFDDQRDRITVEDVLKAIQSTPRGITKDMLVTYETWNAARMR